MISYYSFLTFIIIIVHPRSYIRFLVRTTKYDDRLSHHQLVLEAHLNKRQWVFCCQQIFSRLKTRIRLSVGPFTTLRRALSAFSLSALIDAREVFVVQIVGVNAACVCVSLASMTRYTVFGWLYSSIGSPTLLLRFIARYYHHITSSYVFLYLSAPKHYSVLY